MASFIDPQPRNAIRLLIAPSLQFIARDAGPRPFTGSSHVGRSFHTTLGPKFGITSLRVRVMRQAWGCLPGTDGLQQFYPFFCSRPSVPLLLTCSQCVQLRSRRPDRFPAGIQENPARTPILGPLVSLSASQGASDGAGPPGLARRRSVAGVFPPAPSAKPSGASSFKTSFALRRQADGRPLDGGQPLDGWAASATCWDARRAGPVPAGRQRPAGPAGAG